MARFALQSAAKSSLEKYMLESSIEFKSYLDTRQIYIKYSTSCEDLENLKRLVCETRLICKIAENTSLRILRTFKYKDNFCVLMYLGKKLKATELEKRKLCNQARAKIEHMIITLN
jgi:hypothetical protein